MPGDELACILRRTFPTALHNSARKEQWFHQNPYPWLQTNGRVWFLLLRDAREFKTMTLKSIKTLLTNCPQICQIMEVTKCFAASIAIHKDGIYHTTQPEPTAYDPKCNHILQSDMKETVVNKSTTGFKKKKRNALSAKRAIRKCVKNRNHISLAL